MKAAILIRGSIGARQGVKDTLKMLNLTRKHNAVVLEGTPTQLGMLQKCKDFITYGDVSEEMAKKLEKISKDGVARLHPPRKGLKSIKRPFNAGGDLGNRGEDINNLLERMLP